MRLQQIDLLRGIAALLVVFFHQPSIDYLNNVGWMGVDLFFVLSGYLISSLIFKEILKYNNFQPVKFLIRRGFKIYPTFYFFLILTIVLRFVNSEPLPVSTILYEATFTRNYLGGFWAHTWTLCVEEHFYFLLAFVLYLVPVKKLENSVKINSAIITVLATCLLLRIGNFILESQYGTGSFFNNWARNVHTMYRLDALAFGVLISYNLHYGNKKFIAFFNKYKSSLLMVAIPAVLILPVYLTSELQLCILKTILYLGFGIILLAFVIDIKFYSGLKKIPVLNKCIDLIAYIGLFSYPIYLIHPMIRDYVIKTLPFQDYRLVFIVYLLLSIVCGIVMYYYIEKIFLAIREKYFPNRKLHEVTKKEVIHK
jgi:peptidoglycan/LPS O-acetylase OafA/YrhL